MKCIIKNHRALILWVIFVLTVAIGVSDITGSFLTSSSENHSIDFARILSGLAFLLAVALLILHASWTLGYNRGIAFILLAALTGFIFEIVGVNHGVIFGGHYVYQGIGGLAISGVPCLIPLYWSAFIYAGYNIVSSFLLWINKDKPCKHGDNAILLPLLIFLDGLVVVSIDIFMEPLQVVAGNWIWLDGGYYYGIPLGNFAGWFVVAIVSTGIFRVFEYLWPHKSTSINKSVFLIPVIGYAALCLIFLFLAILIQLPELALTGSLVMFPVVIANLILFFNWKRNSKATMQLSERIDRMQ